MMDAMDAILSRRSIRRYKDKKVPEEVVKKLLEAGMAAPSAKNRQPWRFIVIDDRELLDEIPNHQPYSSMLRSAPLAICVCGEGYDDVSRAFWVQDCSAATQNILLAAHALGLGAVWLGFYPNEEYYGFLNDHLNIPDGVIPLCLISIGYPAEDKPRSERFDASKVFRNTYG